MKKLLTLASLLGAASLSFGQGNVNFANTAGATTHTSTNAAVGGAAVGRTAAGAGSYYYALFVADSTITSAGTAGIYGALDPTLTAGWVQVANAYATNGAIGRLSGNPSTDDVPVAGRATGSSASFIIVGWSSTVAGPDWASAKVWIDATIASGGTSPTLGWTGASGVATSVQLGGGITPAGTIFGGVAAGTVPGILLQLQNVPEPGTFALAGLGAAALLIFRRRK
jgi:hypothetical protein